MATDHTEIEIINGGHSVTAVLTDTTAFTLVYESYAPGVAGRRESPVDGYGPFNEIGETLSVEAKGANAAAARANARKLARLIDLAERWYDGETADPTLFKITPHGSTTAIAGIIEGRTDRSQNLVELPVSYPDHLQDNNASIGPINLRFIRHGLLLETSSESQVSSSAANNPVVQSVSLASDHPNECPIDIEIVGFTDTSHLLIHESTLIVAADNLHIGLIEAENCAGATGYTSVADAANKASGGNVLRYTATVTTERQSNAYAIPGTFAKTTETIAVFARLKNRSSSATFKLKAVTTGYSSLGNSDQETEPFTVDSDYYNVHRTVFLGYVTQRDGHQYISFKTQASTAIGSPTLDIDYVVLLAIKPTSYVIRIDQKYLDSAFTSGGPSNVSIVINQDNLVSQRPLVGYTEDNLNTNAYVGFRGDAAIYIPGQEVAALWIGGNDGYWVDVNQSTAAVTQVTLKARRTLGYLLP